MTTAKVQPECSLLHLTPSRHIDMHSEALNQFVSVTGATPDAAQFFLDSSNGDVAAAIDQYFTTGGQAQQEEHIPAPSAHQQAAAPTAITPQSTAAAATAAASKPVPGTSVLVITCEGWPYNSALVSMPLPAVPCLESFQGLHVSYRQG